LHVTKKTDLGEALNYAKTQRKYLERYLLDGNLEISNNCTERSFKNFVIGRKNWLNANAIDGALANTIYYSVTQTAKENDLNLYEYLTRVFIGAPNGVPISQLMPWSLPSVIRGLV
jgi:hypothetical protein